MKDSASGTAMPTSVRLVTSVCALSGKNLLEGVTKGDKVVRFRGKNRNNTALALKSAVTDLLGDYSIKGLVETSKHDYEQTLVSFVLPVEKLSTEDRLKLAFRVPGPLKRVFN